MKPSDYPLALWPLAASASAAETDHLIIAFTVLTVLLTAPIFVGITWFAIRYRVGKVVDRTNSDERSSLIEMTWMIVPFLLTLFFFVWAARLFDTHKHPPAGAMEISAVGRQWMWKFQHPGGQAEINDLHVPVNQPVLIRMISQDVIHGLYIPALRIQMETLPGRYTELWFNASHAGTYRLFCSEYCGTDHSAMDGLLTVMEPAAYEDWLSANGGSQSMAAAGARLFTADGCAGCHAGTATVRAPSLVGLAGSPVPLEDGRTIFADDTYIRDKILNPDHNKIAGYKQVMPSFNGIIAEDDLLKLVAYVKAFGQPGSQSSGRQQAANQSSASPGEQSR